MVSLSEPATEVLDHRAERHDGEVREADDDDHDAREQRGEQGVPVGNVPAETGTGCLRAADCSALTGWTATSSQKWQTQSNSECTTGYV